MLKIGMPISLSGPFANMGRQSLAGLIGWASDVNVAGGIVIGAKNHLVSLIYDDDTGRKEIAGELTERMICDDRVDLLFGPYSSFLTNNAVRYANKYGTVLWNHGGATHESSSGTPDLTVDILTPAEMYFHGVIDFTLKTNKTIGNIAIIYSDRGKFPRTVASGAAEHAQRLGISQIHMLRYDPACESIQAVINSTQIYNADLILGVGRQEDDIALAKILMDSNFPTHKIALIATPTQKFKQELGSLADGFLGPSQWEEVAVNKIDYGPATSSLGLTDSDYPKAQAYAAGLVAQRCVEQAGTLDNKLLYETSSQLDFRTFYGRFKIDPVSHRQIGHQMVVVQWQSGVKTVIWPRESVIG